jgi:hypothetical protein
MGSDALPRGVFRVYVVNIGRRPISIATVLLCTYTARRTGWRREYPGPVGIEVAAAGAFPLLLPAGGSAHFDISLERLSVFAEEGQLGARNRPIWISTRDVLGNDVAVEVSRMYQEMLIRAGEESDAAPAMAGRKPDPPCRRSATTD